MEDEEFKKTLEKLEEITVRFFKEGRPHWWQREKIRKHNEMKAIQLYQILYDTYLKD